MPEASPFLRIPTQLLFNSIKAFGKSRESSAAIVHIPNEVLLLILNYLSNVDRCSFALACKHFGRLAVLNPHHMGDDDSGFRVRYDFMTLLSRAWLPPTLHFCFRCNHVALIDKHLRDSWYAEDDAGGNAQEKPAAGEVCEQSSGADAVGTRMRKGEWCHWKLRVGNDKRITAWCPKCVTGNLNAMAPLSRQPQWPKPSRLLPTYGGDARVAPL